MNQGFFGFPSISDSNIIDQKEFDISGSYYIPPTAKSLIIFAVGGGGGGGGGVRLSGNGASGGNGGNSGHVVITQMDKKSLNGITHLNIVIGAGGTGGAGSPSNGASASAGTGGGATSVGVPGKKAPFIVAAGNQFGLVGSTSFPNSQAPSGSSVGISILFGAQTRLDPLGSGYIEPRFSDLNNTLGERGARGTTETTGGSIHVLNPLACGGAGGGGVKYGSPAGTAQSGGNVMILDANSVMVVTNASVNYLPVLSSITSGDYAPNDTIYAGGSVNTATPPINSNQLICPECMYSIGFGGAGGGGGASTSANNGANGYRGGGGGGGGGSKNVTAGNGGNGGNGYVKIIAIG